MPCPSCGAARLQSVADHYAVEVRRTDADPEALAGLAPPLRRSVLPGTFCITAFWLTVLGPMFVPPERALPVALTFLALGILTLALWLRARKTDRIAMAAYQKRAICPDCHWHD